MKSGLFRCPIETLNSKNRGKEKREVKFQKERKKNQKD